MQQYVKILFGAILLILVLVGGTASAAASRPTVPIEFIAAESVLELQRTGRLMRIVDVRTRGAFEAMHIRQGRGEHPVEGAGAAVPGDPPAGTRCPLLSLSNASGQFGLQVSAPPRLPEHEGAPGGDPWLEPQGVPGRGPARGLLRASPVLPFPRNPCKGQHVGRILGHGSFLLGVVGR